MYCGNIVYALPKGNTAVNDALEDEPELMNQDPYGAGWIVRMKLENPDAITGMMSAADYKAEIGE